jgi:hypothetical protein
MGNASQDQEQSEFANTGVAKRGSDAKIGGDLMERMEEAEDRTAGGFGSGVVIEFASEETPEGGDAGSRPGGNVEKGAVLDFAVLAEGLAKEDGRRGISIGNLRHVHEFVISQDGTPSNNTMTSYMTTLTRRKINNGACQRL